MAAANPEAASPPAAEMDGVEIVRSCTGMRRLREEWNALAETTRSPLLEHDWLLSAAEAFYGPSDLRLVCVRRSGALDAVAPLALENTPSGARVALLGSSRLYEPGGLLFRSHDGLKALLDTVLRIGAPVILNRVPAESHLCSNVRELTRGRALSAVRPAAASLGVFTGGSWDAYRQTLSSRITENLPRLHRKAERAIGAMRISDSTPAPSEVDDALQRLVQTEGSGWKGRRGSALSQRADLRKFFRRYCHRAAARRRLRVKTLWFADRAGAIELSVLAYGRLWQLKIGHEESLSAYYPGLLLTEASIRSSFAEGLEAYEFLGSAETWEERWRPTRRHYCTVLMYPFDIAGAVGGCRDLVHFLSRRVQRALHHGAAKEFA